MYNLAAPEFDPLTDFDRVVSTKSAANRERLAVLRGHVVDAYSEYVAHGQALGTLTAVPFEPDDRDLLSSLFERLNTNNPCEDIRMTLLASTESGLCPYCRIHDATTLDHILERADFPEFSVFRCNLAPACGRCNTRKQNNRHKAADRPPFHLYFVGYPADSFLLADLDVGDRGVRLQYSLQRPPAYRTDWFAALQRHFEAVDLATRYARRALCELRDRAHQMKALYAVGGAAQVTDYLERDASSRAEHWSENDWLVVALRAAAASRAFCEDGIALL